MATNTQTGLPNELAFEQALAAELGSSIESQEGGARGVSTVRLNELFAPVLHKTTIEEQWTDDKKIATLIKSEADYIPITEGGRYIRLISKNVGLAALVGSLARVKTR
jgi:hypothetical protein